MRKILVVTLLLPLYSFGGIELCQFYKDQIAKIQQTTGPDRDLQIAELLKPTQHAACLADLAKQRSFSNALRKFEFHRTDKQAGASVGTGGTNLVSKGVTAKALSVAAEYGALTESVKGQVVTIKGSLDGLPAALIRHDIFNYCAVALGDQHPSCLNKNTFGFLRRISYGISFDTSRGNQMLSGMAAPAAGSSASAGSTATPVTFNATRHEVSAINGRIDIVTHRDTISKSYVDKWFQNLKDNGTDVSNTASALLDSFQKLFPTDLSFEKSPEYTDWSIKAKAAIQSTSDLEQTWKEQLLLLLDILLKRPSFATSSEDFMRTLSRYEFEQDQLIESVANTPVLAFEYNNNRPVGQNSNSTFRLIYDKGFGQNWSVTGNFAASIYDSKQSAVNMSMSRLRDVQGGLQVDRKLPVLSSVLGAATLSGAYYFQHQASPVLLNVDPTQPLPGITFTGLPSNATQVFAEKGNLHIGQIKLVLGADKTSLRFPIAVSYSNRTELIAKPTWRAQVGISYDFDSLFAK